MSLMSFIFIYAVLTSPMYVLNLSIDLTRIVKCSDFDNHLSLQVSNNKVNGFERRPLSGL